MIVKTRLGLPMKGNAAFQDAQVTRGLATKALVLKRQYLGMQMQEYTDHYEEHEKHMQELFDQVVAGDGGRVADLLKATEYLAVCRV
jgi:hypothetical protein